MLLAILLVVLGTKRFAPPTNTKTVDVSQKAATTAISTSSGELVRVARVIDGDTVDLADGRRVRYVGMDAPEEVVKAGPAAKAKQEECFAKEATEENRKLVEGKTVRLVKDVSELDKYGRLLRYVYIDDVFVNDVLVRSGHARVMGIPPDTAYYVQLKQAQEEARVQARGLWGACK